MMRGALPVARGIVLAPPEVPAGDLPPAVTVLRGGHPAPTREGIESSLAILEAVRGLRQGQTLLFLLSGGASALLEAPSDDVEPGDLIETHGLLVGSGADIGDINRVRACLSAVKAGALLRAAAPARVVTLAISDVRGDDPAVIGSGPTFPQPIDASAAWQLVQGLGLRLPRSVQARLERLAHRVQDHDAAVRAHGDVDYRIIACAADAAGAAGRALQADGYRVTQLELAGSTEEAAARIAAALSPLQAAGAAAAIVAAGETLVRLPQGAAGRGGRNLDLAARLAIAMGEHAQRQVAVVCAGTDGRDGSSTAAGGVVDTRTAARAAAAGRDLRRALAAFDTEPALAAADALLVTGPTGTNVGDLLVAVTGAGPQPAAVERIRGARGPGSC